MERTERFFDTLLAVLVVALLCTNALLAFYISASHPYGLLFAACFVLSGVIFGVIFTYFGLTLRNTKDGK